MKDENPIEFMIQYLKKEKITIDFEEYKFQTETHPDYPSLLSFSESLSFFNIDNIATRVPKDQFKNIPDRFIALLEPKEKAPFLSFVEQKTNGVEYFLDGSMHTIDEANFLNLWSGIVLIAEQTKDTVQTIRKRNSITNLMPLIALILIGLLTMTIRDFPFSFSGFAFLSLLGIFLAFEALKQEFGIKNTISSGVCNSSSNTDCHSVISSAKVKFFGTLGLSDISIIYFPSQLISFLILGLGVYQNTFLQSTLLSLAIAIPITLFSLHYQYNIAKKWCPVCLGIVAIIYAQLITLGTLLESVSLHLDIIGLLATACIYLFFTGLWLHIKPFIKEFFALKSFKLDAMRFQRNYSLFKNALKATRKVEPIIMSSKITLGNPSSALQISVITNPFCKFCEGAHEAIHTIIKRNGMETGISLRFNIHTEKTALSSKLLHQGFIEIYKEKGGEALLDAMDFWFLHKDKDLWFAKYKTSQELNPEIMTILQQQYSENAENELMFTPAIIINEYLYPSMYKPTDLPRFISELEEDTDVIVNENSLEVLQ
ncbi:vitamin K epoxide reductase family protein [Ascidiimonas sp. W6]|uniref:vitamin K epoxide reductase family protein n=1 Tax=Ascidiimonas meishanensis TaxID=3128903 RepID=UPI0030EE531B